MGNKKQSVQDWAEQHYVEVIQTKSSRVGWSELTDLEFRAVVNRLNKTSRDTLALLLRRQRKAYWDMVHIDRKNYRSGGFLAERVAENTCIYAEARDAAKAVRELLDESS